MGEQVNLNDNKEEGDNGKMEEKKEEEAAAPAPAAEAEKEEEAAAADAGSKEEQAPPPPLPVILGVELHCTGCAKRIRRCILRSKGVQGVQVDMTTNQLTVTGIVDPQALCARLRQKTLRGVTVISPPPPPTTDEDQPAPPLVHSQVNDVTTVELLVNMHCEACAQQLQKKILKMKGVQSADANFSAGKLTVTSTVPGDKLAEYIHRRTGKLATVVPEPAKPKEEDKQGEPSKDEPPPPATDADKKEENKEEGKPAAEDGNKKNEEASGNKEEAEEANKPAPEEAAVDEEKPEPEEMMKRMLYWPPYGFKHYTSYYHGPAPTPHPHPCAMNLQWLPPPPPAPVYYSYMVERPPPAPQLFSDENPNACVIS